MLTMQTSSVQPFIVLDGLPCPTSACLETGWTDPIDLSPNIDLESRSGAPALETQVCCNCVPEAIVSYVATKAQRVATYDPAALQRVKSWPVVGL